jgi:hypothetical protein
MSIAQLTLVLLMLSATGCDGDARKPPAAPVPAPPAAPPAGLTAVGARWTVDVEQYSEGWRFSGGVEEDIVVARASVFCEVVGEGGAGEGEYWIVELRRDHPPVYGGAAYRIHSLKKSPELLHVESIDQPDATAEFKLRRHGAVPYLWGVALPLLPLELPGGLDEAGTVELQVPGKRVTLRRTVKIETDSVEVLLEVISPVESHTIRQVWDKGLRWWTRYERFVEGHPSLIATLVEKDD